MISNIQYFNPLPNDIADNVLCKTYYDTKAPSCVCKNWAAFFKNIHKYLPLHKRNELIQRLSKQGDLTLIKEYKKCKLRSSSTVEFVYNFLGKVPKHILETQKKETREKLGRAELKKQALALTDMAEMSTATKILSSILDARDIECAFAFAAKWDETYRNCEFSKVVQKFLLDQKKLGLNLEKAFLLTEVLNTEKTRIPALTALFELAVDSFNSALSQQQLSGICQLREHPFIKLLNSNTISKLPISTAMLLMKSIARIINCLLFDKSAPTLELFENTAIIVRTDKDADYLLSILFKNIPQDFDFYKYPCVIQISSFYETPINNLVVLQTHKLKNKKFADDFLNYLNRIPHAGLKRKIYENLIYDFMGKPNILEWFEVLDNFETRIGNMNRAKKELILQYITEDLSKFKTIFRKTENFERLVNVLETHPSWFVRFEKQNNAQEIYAAVGKLLINGDKSLLLKLLIDNIENQSIKETMKKKFSKS